MLSEKEMLYLSYNYFKKFYNDLLDYLLNCCNLVNCKYGVLQN